MAHSEKIQQRIDNATASTTQAIFPGRTNHHNTLFGGEALAWMDEIAFVCATRFCRKSLVTISTDQVQFTAPIQAGTILELVAKVHTVGRTSLTIEVTGYVEDMYTDSKQKAIQGTFKFVAIDENKQSIPVLQGLES